MHSRDATTEDRQDFRVKMPNRRLPLMRRPRRGWVLSFRLPANASGAGPTSRSGAGSARCQCWTSS